MQHRQQLITQIRTTRHPLVVATATVLIGTVEAAARKRALHPTEECFVPFVHPQGDLRLTAVSAEVPFAYQ